MVPSIFCFSCKRNYIVDSFNTKIGGPIIETECPFCREKTIRNFSKFVEIQVGIMDGRLPSAIAMLDLAKAIEKKLIID